MSDAPEVFDFVDEYLRDRASGRERELSHYLARYKGHEESVAREFLALRAAAAAPKSAVKAADARQVGSYRLITELGRGGQGMVWIAEDTRIARRVALKLLPNFFSALSAEKRQRFQREAEIVSRLAHPALATIYEADIEGETPFIAMRYVEGSTLADFVERAKHGERDPKLALPPRDSLEIADVLHFFERAARALHAAHEAGVVHRDVKPANIMVDQNGEPVLLDFGLAREESGGGAALTMSGEVFGTPSFMSPEQIEGSSRALDRRSDVWSLGASLYEALTLERPFRGESVAEILRSVRESPLADARAKNDAIPRDLAIVIETALEKDRERRYASALEFAEDLRRVREYEPIRARAASALLKLRRWSQRHPALAATLAALFVTLIGGLAWTSYLLAREERALQFALGRHLAERAVDLLNEDPSASLVLGIQAVERAPNEQTRGALFAALGACRLERTLGRGPARRQLDLRASHDGKRAVAGLDDGIARVYSIDDGTILFDTPTHPGDVRRVRWLAGDGRFATASTDRWIRVFDLPSRSKLFELELDADALDLDATLDGQSLAALGSDGTVKLWSSDGGEPRSIWYTGMNGADRLRLAPTGDRLAIWSFDKPAHTSVGILDETSASAVATFDVGAAVRSVEFSRFGVRLAIGAADSTVRILRAENGAPIGAPLVQHGAVCMARFSPDGSKLGVALEDGPGAHVVLWNLDDSTSRDFAGHEGARVSDVAFSPDGSKLASASHDLSVRIFDARDGRELGVERSFLQPLGVQWTNDGRRVLSFVNSSDAHVLFGGNRPDVYELVGHTAPLTSASFAPDGERALTTSEDATARVWSTPATPRDGDSGRETVVFRGHRAPVRGGLFARDGASAMTWSDDGTLRWWNTATGDELGSIELGAPVRAAEFDCDSKRFVAVAASGVAKLGLANDARSARVLGDDVRCAHFTPDGRHVVTGHLHDLVCVWSAQDGALEREHRCEAADATRSGEKARVGVVELALRGDGEQIAAACDDLRVRFFATFSDGEARKPLVVFPMQSITFDASGRHLFVTGPKGRGAMKLFELATDAILHPEVYHTANLTGGSFSDDGRFFMTTSDDATVYVRETVEGVPFAHLRGHRDSVVAARFSPKGTLLRVISASRDSTARVSPVDPLPSARARIPRELSDDELGRETRLALPLHYP